jgi:hypothetical protein
MIDDQTVCTIISPKDDFKIGLQNSLKSFDSKAKTFNFYQNLNPDFDEKQKEIKDFNIKQILCEFITEMEQIFILEKNKIYEMNASSLKIEKQSDGTYYNVAFFQAISYIITNQNDFDKEYFKKIIIDYEYAQYYYYNQLLYYQWVNNVETFFGIMEKKKIIVELQNKCKQYQETLKYIIQDINFIQEMKNSLEDTNDFYTIQNITLKIQNVNKNLIEYCSIIPNLYKEIIDFVIESFINNSHGNCTDNIKINIKKLENDIFEKLFEKYNYKKYIEEIQILHFYVIALYEKIDVISNCCA